MSGPHLTLTLNSEEDTARLGQRMAQLLKPGDVLLLQGPVGAGKTFFARSLILSLLSKPEDVPSPTFTLVQTYEAPAFEIWHCDLYRLTCPEEVLELGLENAMDSAVCLIEWPERLGGFTPDKALTLTFETGDGENCRNVTLSSTDPRWNTRVETVHDLS